MKNESYNVKSESYCLIAFKFDEDDRCDIGENGKNGVYRCKWESI